MEEAIQINDRWYIPVTSPRVDDRTRVLKSTDGFAIFSRHGEIGRLGLGEQGLYFLGSRHLSDWRLVLAGREPMLLNSTVRLDNSRLAVDQTTPDLMRDDVVWIPSGTIHLQREIVMHGTALTERLTVSNYHDRPHELAFEYRFNADFRDIFEVRGAQRPRRGSDIAPMLDTQAVVLGYEGLDGVVRRTRIGFNRAPESMAADVARFRIVLAPGERWSVEASVICDSGGAHFNLIDHGGMLQAIDRDLDARHLNQPEVWTDNEQFNDWLNRSMADLQMLNTETRYGLYPYAGVPWFATPFGRDGLITAMQILWMQPQVARGVLTFLAATQADHNDPAAEAEPGKIIHEIREGEMPALGEVPFRRYYGSVDATPLFVALAGRYYRRTGDIELIRQIWPNIERALAWMDRQMSQRGFFTYIRHDERGLLHQGWKDSVDSVFHRDGSDAIPPIALCEVQGYAFEAWREAALLGEMLGHSDLSRRWLDRAEALRRRFEEAFWLDDLNTYAIAVDGNGRPCEIRSSNPGHLLHSGIVSAVRAGLVARELVSPAAFSGWGLRTVFAGEPHYNPMSYHNGSVWPHDTALAAAGLARYGFREQALLLAEGLFNASIHFDMHRLPELFCGFERQPGQAPTRYPMACAPQAWASGAVFMLVQSMLGLEFDPDRPRIHLVHPRLPEYINWLRVRGLEHYGARIDFVVRRHGVDIGANIERREGEIELVVTI